MGRGARATHPGLPKTCLLFVPKGPPPSKTLRSKQPEVVGHPRGGGEGAGEAEKVTQMWVDWLIGDRMKRWFSFDASIFFFSEIKSIVLAESNESKRRGLKV